MAILNLKKLKKPIDAQLMRAVRFERAKHRWPGDDEDQILCTFGGGNVSQVTEDGTTEAKVYLPAECGQIFTDQGIGLKEPFRIQFRKTTAGAEYFEIRKLGDAAEPALDPRRYPDTNGNVQRNVPATPFDTIPTEIDATPMARQLTTSINQANQRKAERMISAPAQPQSTQSSKEQSTPNTSNPTAPTGQTGLSLLLGSCMVAAVDAAVICRDYAMSKGLAFTLTEGSIQDLATSALIHLQRMAEMECRYDLKANAALNRVQQNGGHQSWRQ